MHGHLARHVVAGCDLGDELDRDRRGGQHPPDRSDQATDLVQRRHEIALGLVERRDQKVAERVPGQVTGAEPVLHRPAEDRRFAGQRHQALPQVAGRRRCASARSRPDDPPSSATDTIAVSSPA